MLQRRLPTLLLRLALSGLATVFCWRTTTLLQQPREPSAAQEERWMGWAYRRSDTPQIFDEIHRQVPEGEPILLVLRPNQAGQRNWWTVMALYYLPRHPLVGVEAANPRDVPRGAYYKVLLGRGETTKIVDPAETP